MNKKKTIPVTKPSLPPLEEYTELLREIWENKWLTNNGPFHQKFERALAEHLGVKHISLFCNGTIALQVGLEAMGVTGEVITTPFTFAATAHAIHHAGCQPVFCDIDPKSCNIDAKKIEALITPDTSCIMPVHVYGIHCDTEAIQRIADKYALKVFYDAAHAFGVEEQGESVLTHGNLSMVSFHATKVFNTVEGGALVTDDPGLKQRIDRLRNFGFVNETTVAGPGTNGKMNELQAAYGLLQLKYIDAEIEKCHRIAERYRTRLAGVRGIRLLEVPECVQHNAAYFPVFIDEVEYGMSRDALYEKLRKHGIHARRYFYPLVSSFECYSDALRGSLSEAEKIAEQVICLPIYGGLSESEQERVFGVLACKF